ncbi:MAG: heme lyase CcmF/NrfE family subunit [Bradymonadaceae bacterium]
MLSTAGSLGIYGALYIALVGTALSILAGRSGDYKFEEASRFSVYAAFGALALSSSLLLHAFLTHDFSIQYVAEYSDRSMPLFYLVGAFWGGQPGSLLFWATVVSLFGAAAVYVNRDSYRDFMPWVQAVVLAVLSGLLIILAFASNPFESYTIIEHPAQGEGLTPLLQTPKMVIHPPCLLTGLASMTVPFGFAMAALITGRIDDRWVSAARKWILIPWLFLSVGNILGGMWAYEELGWGGYWAWDPVENAAFLPWLLATALIRSLMIQERRGMLKRWNVGLMIGTYVMTVFGTYITRSGLIDSIHTFAKSDIGNYFLVFLLTVIAVSVGFFAWRWPDMEAEETLDSSVSREAAFMLNNWLFSAMTAVVLFGTLWPKIKTWLTGRKVGIEPPWFNRWMIPLGILLLFLMGIGTIIAWRRATIENFKRDFVWPIVATTLLTPLSIAAYWFLRGVHLGAAPSMLTAGYAVATIAGCIFVVSTMVQEFARGVMARRRAHDENAAIALYHLFRKQRRRYGGYVVHLGIVLAFVAFAGNALKLEKDVSLKAGDSTKLGDYTFTFEKLHRDSDSSKQLYIADMTVSQSGGGGTFQMHPGKAVFNASPKMPTSEIDIRSGPLEDVYVALVNFSPRNDRAAFKIFINPFTWWFWAAGVVLVLGTFIAMWPRAEELESIASLPRRIGRIALALSLGALCFVPLATWQLESDTRWGSAMRWTTVESTSTLTPDSAPGDDR